MQENPKTLTSTPIEEGVEKLFKMLPPKEAVPLFQQLAEHFDEIEIPEDKVEIKGRGFPPVAVTLGGLMSIAGVIVSYKVFKDRLRYLITSPEVEQGQGFFSLSHKYYQILLERGLEPVVVPFNTIPTYGKAETLINIMREGAVVLQGVSAELATWFGRNAGIGRLMIYRPENGVGVFRYV